MFLFDSAAGQGRFGVEVGSNLSYLYVEDPYRVLLFRGRPLLSSDFSGIYRHHFTRNAVLQAGASWARRGYVEEYASNEEALPTGRVTTRMDYLELPFSTVLLWGRGPFRLSAEGGAFYRYLIRRHNVQSGQRSEHTAENLWGLPSARYNRHGYGIHGGGGALYEHTYGTLQISFHVLFPLSQHIQSDRLHQTEPYESRLVSYDLSLLYLLPLPH